MSELSNRELILAVLFTMSNNRWASCSITCAIHALYYSQTLLQIRYRACILYELCVYTLLSGKHTSVTELVQLTDMTSSPFRIFPMSYSHLVGTWADSNYCEQQLVLTTSVIQMPSVHKASFCTIVLYVSVSA